MVCNKKAYADLKKDCETCEERVACFSGYAVGVGYLEPCAEQASADLAQPLLVPHDYRDVKIDANTAVTIDLEELKKQLEQELYQKAGLGLQFGA